MAKPISRKFKKLLLWATVLATIIGGLYVLHKFNVFGLASDNETDGQDIIEQISIAMPLSISIPLFNPDSTLDPIQAQNILNALNDTHTAAVDKDMQFRLFSDIGTGDVLSLSRLNWRIVNVDDDRVTFWAAGAYSASAYYGTVSGTARPLYEYSTIRSSLLNNWDTFSAGTKINEFVLEHGTKLDEGQFYDRIWLPSITEIEAWNLDTSQIIYDANGFNTVAWLRSGLGVTNNNSGRIVNSINGRLDSFTGVQNERGVRPALHVSLSSLLKIIQEQETNEHTVTLLNAWDGDYVFERKHGSIFSAHTLWFFSPFISGIGTNDIVAWELISGTANWIEGNGNPIQIEKIYSGLWDYFYVVDDVVFSVKKSTWYEVIFLDINGDEFRKVEFMPGEIISTTFAPPTARYHNFSHWEIINGYGYGEQIFGNTILQAVYTVKMATATFYRSDRTTIFKEIQVQYGQSIPQIEVPEVFGFTFVHWVHYPGYPAILRDWHIVESEVLEFMPIYEFNNNLVIVDLKFINGNDKNSFKSLYEKVVRRENFTIWSPSSFYLNFETAWNTSVSGVCITFSVIFSTHLLLEFLAPTEEWQQCKVDNWSVNGSIWKNDVEIRARYHQNGDSNLVNSADGGASLQAPNSPNINTSNSNNTPNENSTEELITEFAGFPSWVMLAVVGFAVVIGFLLTIKIFRRFI